VKFVVIVPVGGDTEPDVSVGAVLTTVGPDVADVEVLA
jgi:hypothetical protein